MPATRIPSSRAVVIISPRKAALESREIPKPKGGEIVVRVKRVGICKTDIEVLDGALGYYKRGVARYPIVPGHEYAGIVAHRGAKARKFRKGNPVVGECILSRNWRDRKEVGVVNKDGAYADYVVIPQSRAHKVPQGLPLRTAALAEPLATALRGIRRAAPSLKKGAKILVVGAGPLGNLCAQALLYKGYRVAVHDKNKKRLALLPRAIARARRLTALERYEGIVEVTGAKEVLEKVMRQSAAGAAILLLGFPYGEMRYNFEDAVGGDKRIVGSVGGDREDFEEALRLLPKLRTKSFTKTTLPLSEFKKAWALLRSGAYFKIMLIP